MKRIWSILLACAIVFSFAILPANAAEISESSYVISRVSGRLEHKIPAKTTAYLTDEVSLDKGELITYNCTYTPKSASMDFGYVDSNSVFHYLNRTNGNIEKSLEIAGAGQYTLAIRNNEDYAVTVTGTVKY